MIILAQAFWALAALLMISALIMFVIAAIGPWLFNAIHLNTRACVAFELPLLQSSSEDEEAEAPVEAASSYKIKYIPPELPAADTHLITAAYKSNLLDKRIMIMGVAARDPQTGVPVVLQLYPLRTANYTNSSKRKWLSKAPVPWPDLFWLIGLRVQQIGRLEHLGFIKKFSARLQNSPEFMARFEADHRRYAELRWSILTQKTSKNFGRPIF